MYVKPPNLPNAPRDPDTGFLARLVSNLVNILTAYARAINANANLTVSTVADLPTGSAVVEGQMALVTDETGGSVPAFYDGAAWRRVTDRAVVS